MEILQGVWKQHLRPRAVVGYGVKIFFPVLRITSPDHLVQIADLKPIGKALLFWPIYGVDEVKTK